MLVPRECKGSKEDGQPCQAAPFRGEGFCLWHSPDHQEEAAEARRLGGLRRRKERTVSGAYEIESLDTLSNVRRLLEIAVLDTLALENSVARSRTLAYLAQVAIRALEVAEFDDRLKAVEDALTPRLVRRGRAQ